MQRSQLILEVRAVVAHHLLIDIGADRHPAHGGHGFGWLGDVFLIETKGEQSYYHRGDSDCPNKDHPPLSLGFFAEPDFLFGQFSSFLFLLGHPYLLNNTTMNWEWN